MDIGCIIYRCAGNTCSCGAVIIGKISFRAGFLFFFLFLLCFQSLNAGFHLHQKVIVGHFLLLVCCQNLISGTYALHQRFLLQSD